MSSLDELTGTSAFRPILPDPEYGRLIEAPDRVARVVFCSGQVYAALHRHRETNGIRDTAIVRIEELHPFPWTEVQQTLNMHPNATTIAWAQEEPYNGGAWHYVRDRLSAALQRSDTHHNRHLLCVSRPTSATTAAGLKSMHQSELERLLHDTFSVEE